MTEPAQSEPPVQPTVPQPRPSAESTGFEFNRPTIVSLLYLSSPLLGVTALVGVVLAYVWRGEPHEDWEHSHYTYAITTFWLALIGTVLSIMLMVVVIGFLTIVAVGVLALVRSVLSLLKAQRREPMPNPQTWLA
jgi:uncharacterized membrane protein